MTDLTIVSGSPGAGKTTLSARLALDAEKGLHIPSDLFYSFPARPIDPTRPESEAQNTAIIRALGAATATFLESGYEVFLDGIFGPWFLPALLGEIPERFSVAYLLLTVAEDEALDRVRAREGRGLSDRVRSTRASFEKAGGYEAHRFDSTGLDPDAVHRTLRDRLLRGEFRLER